MEHLSFTVDRSPRTPAVQFAIPSAGGHFVAHGRALWKMTGAVDAQNAPTAPWKTLCFFHELPQGLSHQVTHEKLRKAPKYRWETRIDPKIETEPVMVRCAPAVNCTTIHLRRQRHHTVGPARSPRCGACWPTDAIALGEAVQGKKGLAPRLSGAL